MSILVQDSFTGADANPIGGNWTTLTGCNALQRVSNACGGTNAGVNGAYNNSVTLPDDQYAKVAIIADSSGDGGPICRASTSAFTFYLFDKTDSSTVNDLYIVVAGTPTLLAVGTAHTHVSGDVYEIRAIGTTITGWINGVLHASATDTTLTSGRAGIFIVNTGIGVDDFQAGDFVTGVIPVLTRQYRQRRS